jgi:hypothetical protein
VCMCGSSRREHACNISACVAAGMKLLRCLPTTQHLQLCCWNLASTPSMTTWAANDTYRHTVDASYRGTTCGQLACIVHLQYSSMRLSMAGSVRATASEGTPLSVTA